MRIATFLILFQLLVLTSCHMEKEIEVELPAHEQQIMVECFLWPGEAHRALITRSLGFFETEELIGVDGYEIRVYKNYELVYLYNQNVLDSLYGKIYNYYNKKPIVFEEGQSYQIKVEKDGKLIATDNATFLPKVTMDSIYWRFDTDSTAAVFVQFKDDPTKKNYYRMVINGGDASKATTYDGIWSDDFMENGNGLVYSNYTISPNVPLIVSLFHLEEDHYNFLKSLQQAKDANYNPFMEPASIRSTLDGALGVFATITFDRDTVEVVKH